MNRTVSSSLLETDIAAFLASIVSERRLSENTRLAYQQGLERFNKFLKGGGVANYQSPQRTELARYLEALHNQGLSPATRVSAVIALRLFYQWLVNTNRLPAHAAGPVTALTCPKLPERLPRVLTVEGVGRLLDAPCRTGRMYWRDKAILESLYSSGCRASEAVGLRTANLDLETATARVLGKRPPGADRAARRAGCAGHARVPAPLASRFSSPSERCALGLRLADREKAGP